MAKHPNQVKMEQAIKKAGGLLTFEYLLHCLETGRMQSFSEGESLVITEVQNYPSKKVLHIVGAAGTLAELKALEPRIEQFARQNGCSMLLAGGRSGWGKVATAGWKTLYTTYGKELG